MAERADALNPGAASPSAEQGNGRRSIGDIERDIERTRADMSRTIDEIQYQLSPETIKRKAKTRIREGSETMMDRIKQNPAAAALIGVGAWMLFRGDDRRDEEWILHDHVYATGYCEVCGVPVDIEASVPGSRMRNRTREAGSRVREGVGHAAHEAREHIHDARERVSEATHHAGERASQAGHRATQTARRAAMRTRMAARRTTARLEDNPLLLGALGLAAGAILGGLIPETDRERELLGDARDRALDRAKGMAREKADQMRHVATAAKDAAVEEGKRAAEREHLTGGANDTRESGFRASEGGEIDRDRL